MSTGDSVSRWFLDQGNGARFMLTLARLTGNASRAIFWGAVVEALLDLSCAAHFGQE